LPYVTNLDATIVKVGGVPVKEFDADNKVSNLGRIGDGSYRVYVGSPTGKVQGFRLQTSINTSSSECIPRFVNSTFPDNNAIVSGYLTTNTPNRDTHCANKKYVDDTVAAMGDTKANVLSKNDNYLRIYAQDPGASQVKGLTVANTVGATYTGNIPMFNPAGRSETSTSGGGCLVCNIPKYPYDTANKKYVDDNFIAKSGDGTIEGSLTVAGDLVVQGTTHTQDAETLRIVDNIIEINSEKADNATVLSGVAINKNSDSTYGVMYDPTDDTVKFGEGQTKDGEFSFKDGEGAPLAIREDSSNIADGAIMIFDKSKNKLVDSGYTIDGFKQWVKDYIELYMSTTIVENEAGGETMEISTNNYTEENGTLTITIGG